jgi:hypothetical protein
VIEGAFTTLKEFWRRYPAANLVLSALSALLPDLERSLRPIAQIKALRGLRRIMFVYGGGDRATPAEMGKRLFDACNLPEASRIFCEVPEARHTQAFTMASEACRARYLSFLRESLSAA